jgi:single-strand DNA-binding protein
MPAIPITVIGNLTADPELRFTAAGAPVASFTVASNERYRDTSGEWKDGPTSFVRVNAWHELAEHVAECLTKGDRAIVAGTLKQRDYEAKDGGKRTVWEVTATECGAALKYATVKITKARRDGAPLPDDPWSDRGHQAPPPNAPDEEPPF